MHTLADEVCCTLFWRSERKVKSGGKPTEKDDAAVTSSQAKYDRYKQGVQRMKAVLDAQRAGFNAAFELSE